MAAFGNLARSRLHPSLPATVPLLCALVATMVVGVTTLAGDGPSLALWLGDPDDALRLVSVRELLGGAPWFDTTLHRVGAPEHLLSHWSRLVDLPIALLIGAQGRLFGHDAAELITRIIWPLALLFSLQVVVSREAYRLAGVWAAALAALLAATSIGAIGQFRPGRIDHHNVQIACAVAGLLFLVRSFDDRRFGWAAGALIGLGLAVGYEAIALAVPALGFAVLLALAHAGARPGVLRAATAMSITLSAALVVTIPLHRWLDIRCDALSLNLVVLAVCCTVAFSLACARDLRVAASLAIAAAGAGAGAALFAALEPSCLAGPFGQIDAALKPVWLDHVLETKSLLWFGTRQPAFVLAQLGFLVAGAAAQVALWRRRRNVSAFAATGILLLAVGLGCWQVKLMPYASWLAALPLAIFCAQLSGSAAISAPATRMAVALVLSQTTLDVAFGAAGEVLHQATPSESKTIFQAGDPRRPCFQSTAVKPLNVLSPGLLAGDLDLGPYIVALTAHRVVAAPYHRLGPEIIANAAIIDGPPAKARALIRAVGIDYIALCNDQPGRTGAPGATLRTALLADEPIDYLKELGSTPGDAIRIWRVLPPR